MPQPVCLCAEREREIDRYNIVIYIYPLSKAGVFETMEIGERIETHLKTELGPAYKDLAAAAERDNATRASDKAIFYILLLSIIITGGLVFYRLWIHTKVRQQTLKQISKDDVDQS